MFRLLLNGGGQAIAPKEMMTKLGLFKNHPELLKGDSYLIHSDVDVKILDFLMTRIYGATSTEKVTAENAGQLRLLCDELGFSGFDHEICAALDGGVNPTDWKEMLRLRDRVDRHDVLLEQLQLQVRELVRQCQHEMSQKLSLVEKRLEDTCLALHEEIHNNDVRGELQGLKEDIRDKASAADVMALAEDVARLKEAARRLSMEQQRPRETAAGARALPVEGPAMQGGQKAASDKPQSGTGVASTPTQNGREFAYNSTKPLDGIIAQLSRECSGSLDLVVEVTASSTKRSRYGPQNVAKLDTDAQFTSKDMPDSWICYELRGMSVRPTSYSITSGSRRTGPKSWAVEVSNDGSSWVVVDRRENNKDLENKRVTCNFAISSQLQDAYRFIRLRQTGSNHKGGNQLVISALEIFGTFIGPEPRPSDIYYSSEYSSSTGSYSEDYSYDEVICHGWG